MSGDDLHRQSSRDATAVAVHEASHAVIAKTQPGINVVCACVGDNPRVTTTNRTGRNLSEAADIAERQILIDLAGPLAEVRHLWEGAWSGDETLAQRRALAVVLARRGSEDADDLTPALRQEAAALVEKLRLEAIALVNERWSTILRVAALLDDHGELSGGAIDEIIEER
jgi:hypothetical protein